MTDTRDASTDSDPQEPNGDSLVETPAARAERLTREVEELQEALDRARDDELRLRANLENVRKRARQDALAARDAGRIQVLREVLTARDNLQRGLAAAESAASLDAVLEGFRLIEKSLADLLARHGVEPIPTTGQTFDPYRHEAIGKVPATEDHPEGTIVEEVEVGYGLGEQVLRPSRVIVAVAREEPPSDSEAAADTQPGATAETPS